MFNPLKIKRTSVVGIDINCFGVNLIEISTHKGAHCIEGFAKEDLPTGALDGNTIKDSHAVSVCIKRAVEKGHIHTKQAVVAVPAAAVITKVISINAGLSAREIEEFIKMESENYVPYPSHEINIDFQIIGPSVSNLAMQEVQVFMSRSEKVNERVAAVQQAGLAVKIVDIESYAIKRAAQFLAKELTKELAKELAKESTKELTKELAKESTITKLANGKLDAIIAIIDIGALVTNLLVFQGMEVIYTGEEEFASQPLIAAFLHKKSNVDEATNLQLLMDGLLLQIKRMLQFFFSTSHLQYIDEIILAGEIARLPGLLSLVHQKMGVVTSIANPLSYFKVNENRDYQLLLEASPAMMLACGLALHRF